MGGECVSWRGTKAATAFVHSSHPLTATITDPFCCILGLYKAYVHLVTAQQLLFSPAGCVSMRATAAVLGWCEKEKWRLRLEILTPCR